jgi:integrase
LAVGDISTLPQPVPSDRLNGLIDQAKSAFARLVSALVAVHALPGHEIRKLRTADLDLSNGSLQVRRGVLRHTIYLEELTHRLAAEWLTDRHRRWPASANPHLLVSTRSALDPERPLVSSEAIRDAIPKGLTPSQLRQDRMLNEALETADPLRLMRVFGITEGTAMRYISAAHPERTANRAR